MPQLKSPQSKVRQRSLLVQVYSCTKVFSVSQGTLRARVWFCTLVVSKCRNCCQEDTGASWVLRRTCCGLSSSTWLQTSSATYRGRPWRGKAEGQQTRAAAWETLSGYKGINFHFESSHQWNRCPGRWWGCPKLTQMRRWGSSNVSGALSGGLGPVFYSVILQIAASMRWDEIFSMVVSVLYSLYLLVSVAQKSRMLKLKGSRSSEGT